LLKTAKQVVLGEQMYWHAVDAATFAILLFCLIHQLVMEMYATVSIPFQNCNK
jgi:hypothetical protein